MKILTEISFEEFVEELFDDVMSGTISDNLLYTETSLKDFEFWSGAKDRAKYLTSEELDTIEEMLEDVYPEGMTETTVNDFFWFEEDTIAEWLGYESFEQIMDR